MKISPETIADVITHDTQSDIKNGKVEVVITALSHKDISDQFDFTCPYKISVDGYDLSIYDDFYSYDKTKNTIEEEYASYYHTKLFLPTNPKANTKWVRLSYRRKL